MTANAANLRLSFPQHLSTFIMDKAESIVTVDDAIKKLALLDSKDKIWTQEVLLQVTDKAVRLLDCDTQVCWCRFTGIYPEWPVHPQFTLRNTLSTLRLCSS